MARWAKWSVLDDIQVDQRQAVQDPANMWMLGYLGDVRHCSRVMAICTYLRDVCHCSKDHGHLLCLERHGGAGAA